MSAARETKASEARRARRRTIDQRPTLYSIASWAGRKEAA